MHTSLTIYVTILPPVSLVSLITHTRFSLFQSLTKMVDRIRKFQILNDQIFAIVNVHLYESASQAIVAPTAVKHFDPPSPDVKFTVPEELSQQSEI